MNRNIKLAAKLKDACENLQTGDDVLRGIYHCRDRYEYSCNAAREGWKYNLSVLDDEFDEFVESCGLDYRSTERFAEFYDPEERQYARAIWLTMLYHIRKDYENGVIDF